MRSNKHKYSKLEEDFHNNQCELEDLTQEEQDVDFRRQIADKKYAEVSLEVKQLELAVEGLLREITIKQADVDKIKG